jgi:hypothetical protein
MSWQLCFALLFYPFLKRKVYDNEVLNSKYLISVIYEKFIGTPENALQLTEHELKRRLGTAYNQFFVRCYIKRKSILTHPESFLTAPAVWLDETNEYGYASTKEIYKSIMQARKNNKDIYKNQLLVADLWQKYFDNPCTETFRQAQQQLGKLRDKSWLDLFNTCTLKPAEARRLMQKKFECEFK